MRGAKGGSGSGSLGKAEKETPGVDRGWVRVVRLTVECVIALENQERQRGKE